MRGGKSKWPSKATSQHIARPAQGDLAQDTVLWVVPALCALFARAVPGGAVLRHARLQADDNAAQLSQLLAAANFVVSQRETSAGALAQHAFPVAVFLYGESRDDARHAGLVLAATETTVLLAEREHPPRQIPLDDFARRFTGQALAIANAAPAVSDPDAIAAPRVSDASASAGSYRSCSSTKASGVKS